LGAKLKIEKFLALDLNPAGLNRVAGSVRFPIYRIRAQPLSST
jgi:hypothetical protein